MNVMILKMCEPHSWVYTDELIYKFNSFLYGAKGHTETGKNPDFRMQEKIDFETLQNGLQFQFDHHPGKERLLLLTESSEEENQSLIDMLKQVKIDDKDYILCIIVCNDF